MSCKACNKKVHGFVSGIGMTFGEVSLYNEGLCCKCEAQILRQFEAILLSYSLAPRITVCPHVGSDNHDAIHEQYEEKSKQAKSEHNTRVGAHKVVIDAAMSAVKSSDAQCTREMQVIKNSCNLDYHVDVARDVAVDLDRAVVLGN